MEGYPCKGTGDVQQDGTESQKRRTWATVLDGVVAVCASDGVVVLLTEAENFNCTGYGIFPKSFLILSLILAPSL